MKTKVTSLLAQAKYNIEDAMRTRRQNHDPSWPPHNLLCECNRCMKQEFQYIKEMRKENRLARQKARQKVSK